MDYCCYGADIIRLLFGMPKSVMGWRQTLVKDYLPADSDDNGMVVCFYDNAVARAEASWCEIPGYHATTTRFSMDRRGRSSRIPARC